MRCIRERDVQQLSNKIYIKPTQKNLKEQQNLKYPTYFSRSVKSRSTLEPEEGETGETEAALYILIRHNEKSQVIFSQRATLSSCFVLQMLC